MKAAGLKATALSATGSLVLALAIAAPAAARSDDLQPRTTGLPASAIAERSSADALDEGRMLLAGNNPAQAISAFHIALAQAPQSVAALNGLAVAYDRLGRSDLARQHFEMALALEPDAPDIAYNLGLALVRAGQDRAAIPHLQRAANGNDARAAAAARRTLAQVAARLTAPPAPAAPIQLAAAPASGSRIDMASSGEAVLVLAPAIPSPAAAPRPAPTRLAAVEPALAARLGDMAALTIPIALPTAAPPEASPEASISAAAAQSPQPRRVASRIPAAPAPSPPEQPAPAPAASLPAIALVSPPRQPAIATLLVHGLQDVVAGRLRVGTRREGRPPAHLPAPLSDDRTPLIRQAIARLESLVALIEVQRV